MHEIALLNNILKIAQNKIGDLAKLRVIELAIGKDSCVSYETLSFALKALQDKYQFDKLELAVEYLENSDVIKVKSLKVEE